MLENLSASKKLTNTAIPLSAPRNDAKYDLIKFFLSLLVLAIHSTLYPMILYPWLRIAVPLFFIISSKFVFLKLRDASKEEQKVILKKFIVRNLHFVLLLWYQATQILLLIHSYLLQLINILIYLAD